MINLDRCKTMFLKAVLGLSHHTLNTFVLALVGEKTLCENLKVQGHHFGAWKDYEENVETRRKNFRVLDYRSGPAFNREDWKLDSRIDRAEREIRRISPLLRSSPHSE